MDRIQVDNLKDRHFIITFKRYIGNEKRRVNEKIRAWHWNHFAVKPFSITSNAVESRKFFYYSISHLNNHFSNGWFVCSSICLSIKLVIHNWIESLRLDGEKYLDKVLLSIKRLWLKTAVMIFFNSMYLAVWNVKLLALVKKVF